MSSVYLDMRMLGMRQDYCALTPLGGDGDEEAVSGLAPLTLLLRRRRKQERRGGLVQGKVSAQLRLTSKVKAPAITR